MPLKGPAHPRWSSKKLLSSKGYVKLRVGVGHPCADTYGYAYEHLVIWMAAGNARPMQDVEELHHINGYKDDNRIENLEIIGKRYHANQHLGTKTRSNNGQFEPENVF